MRSDLAILGLDDAEQAVYLHLLGSYRATPQDLEADLGLDARSVANALGQLRGRGLVTASAEAPTQHLVVDPRDALTARADGVADALVRLRQAIPSYGSRFDQVRLTERLPERTGVSLITADSAEMSGWYARLLQRAKSEFLILDRPPYVSTPIEPMEESSLRRGVDVRALYVPESFDRPGSWEEVIRLVELGERARLIPELPLKLAVADRQTALVSLTENHDMVEALVTSAPGLVLSMTELFENCWARGMEFTARRDDPRSSTASHINPDGTSDEERRIISLIGSGATDEAIAARLGVSTRSVRRRTQTLMRRLNASNRFQFGVLAERAGLL